MLRTEIQTTYGLSIHNFETRRFTNLSQKNSAEAAYDLWVECVDYFPKFFRTGHIDQSNLEHDLNNRAFADREKA